jgi:hypothetical protein
MMADPVYTMARSLLNCLQAQFDTPIEDLAEPEHYFLQPGEQISEDIDPINGADLCCEGAGWVRIGDTYPSSNFPAPDDTTKGCFPTGWAQVLEIGLLGCYIPGGEERMATDAERNQAAVEDAARLDTIKRAICCWGNALKKTNPGRLWFVQSIVVSGPRGNCLSRVGTILVGAPKCC